MGGSPIEGVRDRARRIVRSSRALTIARLLVDNWTVRRRTRSGKMECSTGATHRTLDLAGSLRYIDGVFEDYLTYSGLGRADLQGKRILELGPGDSLGVALRFLATGAKEVVCLDRFFSERNGDQQLAIYRALRERLSPPERDIYDAAVDLRAGTAFDPSRLRYVYGIGIERAREVIEKGSIDAIVSRAVLEHVYDPDASFASMDALLAPGGRMIHKIDLRDHGMFSDGGFHPLTFLTVSDRIYDRLVRDSGKPNRRLIDYYRARMKDLRYEAEFFVTHAVGRAEEILPHVRERDFDRDAAALSGALPAAIRERLLPRFRSLSDRDLRVSGIFLIARKPG